MRKGWDLIIAAGVGAALAAAGCGAGGADTGGGSSGGRPPKPPLPAITGELDAGGGTAEGGGPAGHIDVSASLGSIRIDRSGALSTVVPPAVPIAKAAGALVVDPGETVTKSGVESFGAVNVKAGGAIELAGDYEIDVTSADVLISGEIRSGTDPATGNAFRLTIHAKSGTRRIVVDGTVSLRGADVGADIGGHGGACTIVTDMGGVGDDQGTITVRGLLDTGGGKSGGSRMGDTGGNAGDVTLTAAGGFRVSGKLQLRGGDAAAGTRGAKNPSDHVGRGGRLTVAARGDVEIVGTKSITASGGSGDTLAGGPEAGSLALRVTGGAGAISVNGTNLLCEGGDSHDEGGPGGALAIEAPGGIQVTGSRISARAGSSDTSGGKGGTCVLSAPGGAIAIDALSAVDASGGDGSNGGPAASRTMTTPPAFDVKVEALTVTVHGTISANGGSGTAAGGSGGIVYCRATASPATPTAIFVVEPAGAIRADGGGGPRQGTGGYARLEVCGGNAGMNALFENDGTITARGSQSGIATISPGSASFVERPGAVADPMPQPMMCPGGP